MSQEAEDAYKAWLEGWDDSLHSRMEALTLRQSFIEGYEAGKEAVLAAAKKAASPRSTCHRCGLYHPGGSCENS
jgi:hypothetical protein